MDYFKKNKLFIAIIAVLALLNILSISFILLSPIGSGFMNGREHVQSFLEDELKLTDAQKNQYAALRSNFFARGDSMAVIQAAVFDSLFVLMNRPTADTAAVRRQALVLGSLETNRSIGLFEHFHAIRAFCTPEQQKKFDSMILQVFKKIRDPRGLPPPR